MSDRQDDLIINPEHGGDVERGWAYIVLPDHQAAVSVFLGDGTAPFTITDAMEDVDLADLDVSSLQRAVLVARLRSMADQFEAEGKR